MPASFSSGWAAAQRVPKPGLTLAGLMGVADVTATKPPHPRPPPLYARNDNSEPPGTVIQRIESVDQNGGSASGYQPDFA
jgi:hypothetical protein